MAIYRITQPSYYGPKGAAIIEGTMMQIVGVLDRGDSTTSPLTITRFARYFLVPYTAAQLIASDLECDLQLGYKYCSHAARQGPFCKAWKMKTSIPNSNSKEFCQILRHW